MDLGSLPAASYDHNTLEQCQHYQPSGNQPAVKTAQLLGDETVQLADERKQANEQHYNRKLDYYWQADGCLVLSAVLTPEIGAKLLTALNSAYETLQI